MNAELFKKHFNFQRPSDMLKFLYKTNTSQNNELVSLINSGLIVEKLKRCPKNKEKLKSQIRQLKLLKKFLNLMNKINKEKA